MKILNITILYLVCTVTIFAQNIQKVEVGNIFIISEECKMYDTPSSIFGKPTTLIVSDSITILKLENKEGYFAIKCKEVNGYINSSKLVILIKYESIIQRRS
jgi:hypothetical protein